MGRESRGRRPKLPGLVWRLRNALAEAATDAHTDAWGRLRRVIGLCREAGTIEPLLAVGRELYLPHDALTRQVFPDWEAWGSSGPRYDGMSPAERQLVLELRCYAAFEHGCRSDQDNDRAGNERAIGILARRVARAARAVAAECEPPGD